MQLSNGLIGFADKYTSLVKVFQVKALFKSL